MCTFNSIHTTFVLVTHFNIVKLCFKIMKVFWLQNIS